jgi:hypothetical protein
MTQAIDETAALLAELGTRIRNLETRLALLEQRSDSLPRPAAPAVALPAPQPTRPPATWRGFPAPKSSGGLLPIIGKAVLGIAGAYLLRAIAESSAIPQWPVLVVAVVYAGLWLVGAVRSQGLNDAASVTYGITSILIFSPLLWESTVRFHVLTPFLSGFLLVGFFVLLLALTWHRNLQLLTWLTILAVVNTAFALIVATHALVPITTTLLLLTLITEVAVCFGRPLSMRVVPAIAAQLALLLTLDVLTSSEGVPEGYSTASPVTLAALCLTLLIVYGGSIAIRAVKARQPITLVDLVQGTLAFLFATFGTLQATHGKASVILGIMNLLLAGVCYWGVFRRFAAVDLVRNRVICAIWGPALFLAALLLLFPQWLQTVLLSVSALAASYSYQRSGKIIPGVHASIFLATAGAFSGLFSFVTSALAGTTPPISHWYIWAVPISAVLCYRLLGSAPSPRDKRVFLLLPAALIMSFAGAGLAVVAIQSFTSGRVEFAASRLSALRTLVNCGLALLLAYLGSHWKRPEFVWTAYAAVSFGTLKLLLEDLRFGNATSLVFSLLSYGLILILLPRLIQQSRTESRV